MNSNQNFQPYLNQNSTELFTNLLEQNQKYLVKAYEYQNSDNFEESVNCLEKIARHFHVLGIMADQFAYTPEIIQENRELLSQAHLDTIYDKFPKYELNKNIHVKNNNKKTKQCKVKWSEREQNLFLEGIEKYGTKNLKEVSELIGTRTVGQVRSHLQKHILKEKKKKDVNNNKKIKK